MTETLECDYCGKETPRYAARVKRRGHIGIDRRKAVVCRLCDTR